MNDDELDYVSPPPIEVRHYRYVPLQKFEEELARARKLVDAMKKAMNLLWYREAEPYGILDQAIKVYES